MENKIEEARARKRSGEHNCAQAVACTYSDLAGLDEETLLAATHAFGAGMATMEGTCGAPLSWWDSPPATAHVPAY